TAILRISWDEAWHCSSGRWPVARPGRSGACSGASWWARKAMAKGHRYLTLGRDLEAPTIEYVAEDRKQASLAAYFAQFPESERAALTAVALDMWDALRACDPDPGAAGRREDGARSVPHHEPYERGRGPRAAAEHRELRAQGDERLTGTKHVRGYGEGN